MLHVVETELIQMGDLSSELLHVFEPLWWLLQCVSPQRVGYRASLTDESTMSNQCFIRLYLRLKLRFNQFILTNWTGIRILSNYL